jgi:N6-L-threonylcarbamoyladenine synthase
VEALVGKTQQMLAKSSFASLGLCGGVANNLCLRSAFERLAHQHQLSLHLPERRHSGDNAAMIAFDFFMEDLLTAGASPKLDPCLTIEI